MREAAILQGILLALGTGAVRLWRNNVGVGLTPDGDRVIRYGVANPGGSDLIGLRSVVVTPEMVGRTLAVFVALEVKQAGKRPTAPQEQFQSIVRKMGGIAVVAHSEQEARAGVLDATPGVMYE